MNKYSIKISKFLQKIKISNFFQKKKKKSILSKSFQKKEKKKNKEIFKKGLRTKGIGLVLLRLLSKKKNQSKFSIPWKNSRFPNFSKKKFKIFNSFEKFKFFEFKKKKKKIFIKFFFRNRKLWSSSIFSNGATSSQLSTLSIHRSMEYVLN